MILKQLRLSRLLSQEQLAQMSGLSVRTIQRIESGHSPSVESLKCLASVLEVDVSTLSQEKFMIDKQRVIGKNCHFYCGAGSRSISLACARAEVQQRTSKLFRTFLAFCSAF